MSTETERARELLASSEEALERSRNRPTRLLTATTDEPQFTREAQAVVDRMAAASVRRMAEHTAKRTMSKESQARWNDWAGGIARTTFYKLSVEHLAPIIADALKERDDRIAELEQRVINLEQPGKVAHIARVA